jgi:hypothetical protein
MPRNTANLLPEHTLRLPEYTLHSSTAAARRLADLAVVSVSQSCASSFPLLGRWIAVPAISLSIFPERGNAVDCCFP